MEVKRHPMYGFISSMWEKKAIDENKVRSYVPTFIDAEECELILTMPQAEDK